jgi:hypothetical protein
MLELPMPTPRLLLISILAFVLMGAAAVLMKLSQVNVTSLADQTAEVAMIPSPSPTPYVASTLIGAGDIASCTSGGDEKTATLIENISGTVFTLGDNVYQKGTTQEFTDCYAPTWGKFKDRTKPVAGNHDYETKNAAGYFAYFGDAAGDPAKGYYTYDAGNWKVVVLNSNCSKIGGCGVTSPQYTWLKTELAGEQCVVAMMHHPRFNSGSEHGNTTALQPFWELFYQRGVEIALAGHEHLYERFAPLNADGEVDLEKGVRAFTVGTGGKEVYKFGKPHSGSEVRNSSDSGVLKLVLDEKSYSWEFLPVLGSDFTDSGSGTCR